MDLLSFVVSALDMIVDIAKFIAVVVLVIFMSPLIKCMPMRLRKFVSMLAPILFLVSFMSSLFAQQLLLLTFKTSIILYAFVTVTSFAVMFLTLIASCQPKMRAEHIGAVDGWKNKQLFFGGRNDESKYNIISSSYLNISPVILQ